MKVALDRITVDSRLQHREKLDESMIAELMEACKEGAKIEPITLIFDGETHWMPDGHHRYFGHKGAGLDVIEANVYDGDYRAAWLYSLGVNSNHGVRRTHGDLRRIVGRALEDPELAAMSDGKIAAHINCARSTVQVYRAELKAAAKAAQASEAPQAAAEATPAPPQPNNTVYQPPVVNDEARMKNLRRKVQRVYGQLANLVEQMGLWDVLAGHMADIKQHTGIV